MNLYDSIDFFNIHKDRPGVVLGTGWSVNMINKSILKNFPTFGVNHIVELFEPTYLVSVDSNMTEYFKKRDRPDSLFVGGMGTREVADVVVRELFFKLQRTYPVGALFMQSSSVDYAISMAYTCGCDPIILVGVDGETEYPYHFWEKTKEDGDYTPFRKQRETIMRSQNLHNIKKALNDDYVDLLTCSDISSYNFIQKTKLEDWI